MIKIGRRDSAKPQAKPETAREQESAALDTGANKCKMTKFPRLVLHLEKRKSPKVQSKEASKQAEKNKRANFMKRMQSEKKKNAVDLRRGVDFDL